MRYTLTKAAGPFIGPRGGKWADAKHTIPWHEPGAAQHGSEHHYGAALRPVSHANVPKGAKPMPHEAFRHGVAVYDRPLSADEIRSFELTPILNPAGVDERVNRTLDDLHEYAAEYREMLADDPKTVEMTVRQSLERQGPGHFDMDAAVKRVIDDLKGSVAKGYTFILDLIKAGPYVGPRGGLWADLKHTQHWDPAQHGTERLEAILADLVPGDQVKETAEQLGKLTPSDHEKMLGQVKEKIRTISERGEAVPMTLLRWQRVLDIVIPKGVPTFAAPPLEKEPAESKAAKFMQEAEAAYKRGKAILDSGKNLDDARVQAIRVGHWTIKAKKAGASAAAVNRAMAAQTALLNAFWAAQTSRSDAWKVVNNFQTMPPADAVAKLAAISADIFERMSEQLDEGSFEAAAAVGRVPPHLEAWRKTFAEAKKARQPPPAAKPAPAKPKKPQQQSFILTPPAAKPEAPPPPLPTTGAVGEILQGVIDAAGRSPRALEEHIRLFTSTQLETVVERVVEFGDPLLMAAVQRVLKKMAEEEEARQTLPEKPATPPAAPAEPRKDQPPGWERMPEESARIAAEGAIGKRAVTALQKRGWAFVDGAPKTLKEAGVDAGLTRAQARKVKDAGVRVVRNPNAAPLPEPAQPKSSVTEPKRPPKPREKKERETTRTGERKIKEVGEHIWGARRDLAAIAKELQEGKRSLSSEELSSMSYDDAAYLVTKQNLIPPHDLQTLKALGMTPGGAHMALAVVAAIRTKPDDSKTGRRQYVEDVRNVLGSLRNCKTQDNVNELVQEWRSQYRAASGWTKVEAVEVSGYDSLEAARKRASELTEKTGIEHAVVQSYGIGTFIGAKTPKPFEQFGSRFLSMLKNTTRDKFYREATHEAYTADEQGAGGWDYLQQRSAEKAAPKKRPEAGQTARGFSEAQLYAHLEGKVERTGHTVNVKDANEKRVMKTFGLTNVDFGKEAYMAQADREFHTKSFEGAMHDFAEVLGVDPGILSLNGRLGIAFGARGRGNASAHYESHKKVINITKFRGGGALAHEWGHALDNVIAEHFTPDTGRAEGRFLSASPGSSQLPDKVRTAISKVMHAIEKHPDPERAKVEHREFLRKLRDETEAVIDKHNVLQARRNKLYAIPETQEALNQEIERHEAALTRYQQDLEKVKRDLSQQRVPAHAKGKTKWDMDIRRLEAWMGNRQKEIAELKEKGVKTDAQREEAQKLASEIESARIIANRARKIYDLNRKMDPTQSRYSRSAEVLGKYWSRPWEMFARAFESFVHDELKDAGRTNSYLTGGKKTETEYHTDRLLPGGGEAQPYPHGEERKAIRLAMRELVETLKDTKIIEKALRIIFTIDLVKAQAS